jgi:hypothetical protein
VYVSRDDDETALNESIIRQHWRDAMFTCKHQLVKKKITQKSPQEKKGRLADSYIQ